MGRKDLLPAFHFIDARNLIAAFKINAKQLLRKMSKAIFQLPIHLEFCILN